MKEIVVLTGREGQDEPPQLPEELWIAPPLAAIGEVTMWFIATDPHELFARSMRVAIAIAVGEQVEPFGAVDGPRRVLFAVPRAEMGDLVALGAIAESIRQQEGWQTPKRSLFGIINIPTPEHLPALDAIAAQFLPSVVFIFQPTALAANEDDAVALTEAMQNFARRHETAVVFCLGASEEFIESLES